MGKRKTMEITVGILTISDRGARAEREDKSGPAIKEIMERINARVIEYQIVPDDPEKIKETLIEWSEKGIDLILTTGGTGFSPKDFTPEATREVIERETPGISEAIRAYGMKKTPRAMLSRAISGIRKSSLIINLPGSERGVRESMEVILPVLPHGIEIMKGIEGECGTEKIKVRKRRGKK